MAPRMIHAMMLILYLRPHRGPLTRLLGSAVSRSRDWRPLSWPRRAQRDYVRPVARNNGMSARRPSRRGLRRRLRCICEAATRARTSRAACAPVDAPLDTRGSDRRRPHRCLHLPTSAADRPRSRTDAPGRIDRSMDVLQYGLAFLAIVGAVLLAVDPLTASHGRPRGARPGCTTPTAATARSTIERRRWHPESSAAAPVGRRRPARAARTTRRRSPRRSDLELGDGPRLAGLRPSGPT